MNAIARMAEMAAAENARMIKDNPSPKRRSTPASAFGEVDEQFKNRLVPKVISHLRAGDGVEDIAVAGTCTPDEARQVIAWLRSIGSLGSIYGVAQ